MKYTIINPRNGARIEAMGIVLEPGQTKTFLQSEAEWLLNTYEFLILEVNEKEGRLGAISASWPIAILQKFMRQKQSMEEAKAAKLCPNCGQRLPDRAKIPIKKVVPKVTLKVKKTIPLKK